MLSSPEMTPGGIFSRRRNDPRRQFGAALAFCVLITAPGADAGAQAGAKAPLNVIVWSASRPLTWDDFRARPPGHLTGALSMLSHNYSFGCRDGRLHAEIVAEFLPDQSYVAYRILASGLASRAGLEHEQIHFDLAEVYARRVRKFFHELSDPCPRPDEALEALADKILREGRARQRRYDTETQSGENGLRQATWAKTVERELVELAAFGRAK
jgi:hypothetical protein